MCKFIVKPFKNFNKKSGKINAIYSTKIQNKIIISHVTFYILFFFFLKKFLKKKKNLFKILF